MIHRIPPGTRDVLPAEMRELRRMQGELHPQQDSLGCPVRAEELCLGGAGSAHYHLKVRTAVARMLSCTFPPFHDAGGLSAIAGTLAAIADDVPVTRLSTIVPFPVAGRRRAFGGTLVASGRAPGRERPG